MTKRQHSRAALPSLGFAEGMDAAMANSAIAHLMRGPNKFTWDETQRAIKYYHAHKHLKITNPEAFVADFAGYMGDEAKAAKAIHWAQTAGEKGPDYFAAQDLSHLSNRDIETRQNELLGHRARDSEEYDGLAQYEMHLLESEKQSRQQEVKAQADARLNGQVMSSFGKPGLDKFIRDTEQLQRTDGPSYHRDKQLQAAYLQAITTRDSPQYNGTTAELDLYLGGSDGSDADLSDAGQGFTNGGDGGDGGDDAEV